MSRSNQASSTTAVAKRGRKVKTEDVAEEKPAKRNVKRGSTSAVVELLSRGIKNEPLDEYGDVLDLKQRKLTDMLPVRKKRDRFNGMTEDEVLCRTLPDHLVPDLDIVIVGINPGLTAAYVGHHYAGPGNHFWKCLFLSGLIPEQMNAYDDFKLKEFGIGFTNIVERTSRGSADLTRKEIKEGAEILAEKIRKFKPKIAAFNGKGIYEVFCGHKKFFIGKQPEPMPGTDTVVYVMPSSSARFTQLPRAVDKVPFYVALKKLRDHLCGALPGLDDSEVTFPDLELKVEPKKERLDAPEVKAEVVALETADGTAGTPGKKRRKRKSEKTAEAESSPVKMGSSDYGLGMAPVKLEPGMVPPADAKPSANTPPYNGYALRGSKTSCELQPLQNQFRVKEEVSHDLSQYGMMPSPTSYPLPYPTILPAHLGQPPPCYMQMALTPSVGQHVTGLPSIYTNALTNLAASFEYRPHLRSLPQVKSHASCPQSSDSHHSSSSTQGSSSQQ